MGSSINRKRTRQRYLGWGVVCFLTVHTLSLCTLNPMVHAETLHHAVHGQQVTSGHCALPSNAVPTTASHSAPLPNTPEPLCCKLRGADNKTLFSAPQLIAAFPYILTGLFPPKDKGSGYFLFLPQMQVRPCSQVPPYLLHRTLLI
jgi:hypothetical protein